MIKEGLCGLYLFKNKQGEIIYIGKADDIHKRLKQHRHLEAEQYQEVDSIEYAVVANRADRDILETMLISQINPKYNTTQKYTERPTLVIDSSILLIWQKASPKDYKFQSKKKEHIGTGIPGRPRVELPPKFYELYPLYREGKLTATAMIKELEMCKPTFYRRLSEYEMSLRNQEIDNK